MDSVISKGKTFSGIRGFLFIIGLLAIALAINMVSTVEVESPRSDSEAPGAVLGGDFTLTGHKGLKVSLHDFKGKVVLLFFGYAFCAYACPTTLIEMDAAMTALGDISERVQVLFISIDPARDTPEILEEMVTDFNPAFIGLTGTREEIDRVAAQYAVKYVMGKTDEDGDYSVGHNTTSYLVDKQGRLQHMFPFRTPSEEMANVIRKYVVSSGDPSES